jgi:chondroitin 4-sulfotransferase 11
VRTALRVAFVRIAKNASTSIYEQLGERNAIRDEKLKNLFTSNPNRFKGVFAPSHCSLQEAVVELGAEILSYPTFCVIRNPYDRLVSMYFFANKTNLHKLYELTSESFLEFARLFYKKRNDKNFFPVFSQLSHIMVDGKIAVKHMLNFEIISNHFKQFIEAYNVAGVNAELPQKNSTKHKSYSQYFCTESKKIVEEIWEDDFNEFKFKYEEEHEES